MSNKIDIARIAKEEAAIRDRKREQRIDYVEALAELVVAKDREQADFCRESGNYHHQFNQHPLARFVVAVMPAMRIAGRWRDGEDHDLDEALVAAIDEMRRALDGYTDDDFRRPAIAEEG